MINSKYEPVSCESIFKLSACSCLKLICGEKGLHRPIRWVHYIEDFRHVESAKDGELIIIWGLQQKSKEDILILIKRLNELQVSGIIIYETKDGCVPYIEDITILGDKIGLCIYSLPYKVRLAEITQCICEAIFQSKLSQKSLEAFLTALIYGDVENNEEMLANASSLGYVDKQRYFCAIIILKDIERYKDNDSFKNGIANVINQVNHSFARKILHMLHNNEIITLIPLNESETIKNIETIVHSIGRLLSDYNLVGTAATGVSEECFELSQYKEAYHHARNMSLMASYLHLKCLFHSAGEIYTLLFSIKDKDVIRSVYDDILGELINYDKESKSCLLDTLFTFIEHDLNSIEASEALFIHTNTLRYRLCKVQDILNIKLREPQNIYRIIMALHIHKYLEFLAKSE